RPAGRRLMLRRPEMAVAATDIRRALRHDGADYHLTPAVLAHIRRLGLYNADTVHPTRHAHNEAP
ncbi:MAG TPA: nicotinate-nicotinamide nucleotide adenylyltransferase, partial [Alcanivorax sp.]|nr:nicotinate-nicotinamide nucleotide adenylyltransferase [Alcanivorax sp.]